MVLTTVSVNVGSAVGVQIVDNDEWLPSGRNYVKFVNFFQNGVQVGTVTDGGNSISYNNSKVLHLWNKSGYTFGIMLENILQNGDYEALISYDDGSRFRNYYVSIRVALA